MKFFKSFQMMSTQIKFRYSLIVISSLQSLFMYIIPFNSYKNLLNGTISILQRRKTEAQRAKVTCPRSYAQQIKVMRFRPGLLSTSNNFFPSCLGQRCHYLLQVLQLLNVTFWSGIYTHTHRCTHTYVIIHISLQLQASFFEINP